MFFDTLYPIVCHSKLNISYSKIQYFSAHNYLSKIGVTSRWIEISCMSTLANATLPIIPDTIHHIHVLENATMANIEYGKSTTYCQSFNRN